MPKSPNIVLCICDQLRAFEVGCYGNEVVKTPHIDSVAREGIRFETAVSNYPVCMPARSVLLSGQYNRACTGGVSNIAYPSGEVGNFMLPEYPSCGRPHLKAQTLPETLRIFGYDTAVIGKWHVHSWPYDVGFDSYLIPRVHHSHTAQLFTENGGPEFSPAGYSVDFEADRVTQFIEQRQKSDKPFFLYYSISPPHNPLRDAPDKYLRMYNPEDIPIRPNVDLSKPLENQDYWFRVYRWDYKYYSHHLPYAESLPEDYDLRRLIADYYGLTTWVDDVFGRMLRALDEAGMSDDTIVIFTSDHGDCLGSKGLVQKGVPTEESIRIPLVMRGPGIDGSPVGPENRVASQVAGLVDVMPTLLELIGGDCPTHVHGRSLARVIRDTGVDWRDDFAFVECGDGIAIRSGTHVYHLAMDKDRNLAPHTRFYYDVSGDPYQLRNLAAEASGDLISGDPVARGLDRRLRQWHESTPWMC